MRFYRLTSIVTVLCFSLFAGQAVFGQGYNDPQTLLGEAYKERLDGNYKVAIQKLIKAYQKSDKPRFKKRVIQSIVVTFRMEAKRYRQRGNFKKALDIYHFIEGTYPPNKASYQRFLRSLELSRSQFRSYLPEKSLNNLRYEIARTWEVLGKYKRAKQAYMWGGFYRKIGNMLLREGKYREALKVFGSIVRCQREKKIRYVEGAAVKIREGESVRCPKDGSPVRLAALDGLGTAHLKLGEDQNAMSAYKAGNNHNALASLYERKGQYDKAFDRYRRAGNKLKVAEILKKKKEDKAAKLWYTSILKEEKKKLNRLKEEVQRYRKMEENFKKYGEKDPNRAETLAEFESRLSQIYSKMGDAYFGLGEFGRARNYYEKARSKALRYLQLATNNGRNKFRKKLLELNNYRNTIDELRKKRDRASNQ